MQVKTSRLGVATYLAPDGALTAESVADLAAGAADARARGATDFVIDLRQVPHLDSRGLECLLDLADELRQAGGSLRLANPGKVVQDTLSITAVDQSIPVFGDLESAGGSFL